MPVRNPASELATAPTQDLTLELLKQFKRLLEAQGVALTHAELQASAQQAANHEASPQQTAIIGALTTLVDESLTELQTRFGLGFAQALATPTLPGWGTTAEFLELHNVKSNAELRISAGATLLAFLGDARHADHLLTVLMQDAGANDVDAIFAQRGLAHLSGIDLHAEDWLRQVQAWLQANRA